MSATLLRRALGSAVALGLSPFFASFAGASPVTADAYSNYAAGNASSSYRNPSAALGNLNGNTSDGVGTPYALNPFNPAWQPADIVIVGSGGSLTLQLSQNVQTTGQTLGVYSNVGYKDVGGGTTNSTPTTLGQISQAVVSVSQDGNTWVTLNQGNPISFANATNYYTDVPFANPQPLGNAPASQSKPYLGNASQLTNSTYSQILTQFNGSAGGTWLDLSGTGLPAVNYVRFNVPTGQRMVIDAIGGLGAVNTLAAGTKIVSESVGSGSNVSDVVIDFNNQHSYDFQVHYSTPSITGTQALNLIEAGSDMRYSSTQYDGLGTYVTGFDYAGYNIQAGETFTGSNYWGYYQSTDGHSWVYASTGSDDSTLTNGSYDGWLWETGSESAPQTPFAAPEPGSVALLACTGAGLLLRRRGKDNE